MKTKYIPDSSGTTIRIDFSALTILKLFLTFVACSILFKIWDFAPLLLISLLIAVTLQPVMLWLVAVGVSRKFALAIIGMGFTIISGLFLFFLIPPLFTELATISSTLPLIREEILKNTPQEIGLNRSVERLLSTPVDAPKFLTSVLSMGQYALEGVLRLALMLIFSLYLLMDGPRAIRWFLPYFTQANQKKVSLTITEVQTVIPSYISGQIVTSILAAIFSFLVLASLNVPAYLSLSVMAAIFDILPVIGFFIFTIPACLLALTVSSKTAFIVLLAYVSYHFVETYFIVPRVYGPRMRLSALVILIGLISANSIAGVTGAIAILPILASYPIIERIWFTKQVGEAAVNEHSAESEIKAAKND